MADAEGITKAGMLELARHVWNGQRWRFCPQCQSLAFDFAASLATLVLEEAQVMEACSHAEYLATGFYTRKRTREEVEAAVRARMEKG